MFSYPVSHQWYIFIFFYPSIIFSHRHQNGFSWIVVQQRRRSSNIFVCHGFVGLVAFWMGSQDFLTKLVFFLVHLWTLYPFLFSGVINNSCIDGDGFYGGTCNDMCQAESPPTYRDTNRTNMTFSKSLGSAALTLTFIAAGRPDDKKIVVRNLAIYYYLNKCMHISEL